MKGCLIAVLLFLSLSGKAQLHEYLYWNSKDYPQGKYALHNIEVQDQRGDTAALLGYVRRGFGNAHVRLLMKQPLSRMLSDLYRITTAKKGPEYDLLISLYHFYIYEETTAKGKGFFRYKANYFLAEKDSHQYRLLGRLDTLFALKGPDITDRLRDAVGYSLAEIYQQMTTKDASKVYTWEQASRLDEQELQQLPAYIQQEFPENAVYTTWDDFIRQRPAADQSIKARSDLFSIQYRNKKDKLVQEPVYYCRIFAFEHQLYYATYVGTFKVYRRDHDFFIATRLDIMGHATAPPSYIPPGTASGKKQRKQDAAYEFKLDRKTGLLIPFR